MTRRRPRSTRTDTLFPYTTLFRSPLRPIIREGPAVEVQYVPPAHRPPDAEPAGAAKGVEQHVRRAGDGIEVDLGAVVQQGLGDDFDQAAAHGLSSEDRRVGEECVSPCRSRWAPYH